MMAYLLHMRVTGLPGSEQQMVCLPANHLDLEFAATKHTGDVPSSQRGPVHMGEPAAGNHAISEHLDQIRLLCVEQPPNFTELLHNGL
jgi:hypothetical protein